MNVTGAIARNTGVQLAGRVARLGIGIVTSALLARYLGMHGFGVYSLAFAFVSFFGTIVDFGTNDVAAREFSKDTSSIGRLMRGLVGVRAATSVFAVAACACIALILQYSVEQKLAIIVASVSLPLFGLASLLGAVYRARLRLEYTELAATAGAVAYFGLVILAMTTNLNVIAVIWLSLSQYFLTLVISLVFLRNVWKPDLIRTDGAALRKVVSDSVPAGLVLIAVGLYANIDLVILSKLAGQSAVGLYSAAYKFVLLGVTVPIAFVNSFLPVISEMVDRDRERLRYLCSRAFDFLIAVSFPAVAAVSVLAAPIVLLIYGPEYRPAGPALSVLAWATAMIFLTLTSNTVLVVLNQQRKALAICTTAIFANAGLNFLLIPQYGIVGAAWGTVLTEFWVLIPAMWIIHRYTGAAPRAASVARTALATGIVYAVVFAARPLGLIPAAAIFAVLYPALFLALFGSPLDVLEGRAKPRPEGRPRRLLFVNPVYKPYLGGVERVIERLSTELLDIRAFDQIAVLTTRVDCGTFPARRAGTLPAEEVIDGVRVFRADHYLNSSRLFYHFGAGMLSPRARRIVREFDPDVVHFTFGDWFIPNLMVYLWTRDRARHVYSLFYHDLPARPMFWPMRLVNTFLVSKMDYVHVATEHGKRGVMDSYRGRAERVKVVPLGSNLMNGRAPVREARESSETINILSTARLERLKGQHDLLEAFHSLVCETDRPIRLVLVGGPGDDSDRLKRFIKDNGLDPLVDMTGFVAEDQLRRHYEEADIFVLLSRAESFGLVYVEAMAHGLPVVAYGIQPVTDVLARGALLIEPGDIRGVKEALEKLVRDDDFRTKLGREGREYALAHYVWSRTAGDLVKLYNGTDI